MMFPEKTETHSTLDHRPPFLTRFLHEQFRSLRGLFAKRFPDSPIPVRLRSGIWWWSRHDDCSQALIAGNFESTEVSFVHRFLTPGMTVLDIGAHHGYYTILASKHVGSQGKVFSFEPSPRERSALRWNAILNSRRNIRIQPLALGDSCGETALYVADNFNTGLNSLRAQVVVSDVVPVPISITTLDSWIAEHPVKNVDFIKLDVEGGELDVFKGAQQFLSRQPRPVILAEVQDVRTTPWGYRAKEILTFLADRQFSWFSLTSEGLLEELNLDSEDFEGNFVAWPNEKGRPPAHLMKGIQEQVRR
jgi:FkbM family methyltransferase